MNNYWTTTSTANIPSWKTNSTFENAVITYTIKK